MFGTILGIFELNLIFDQCRSVDLNSLPVSSGIFPEGIKIALLDQREFFHPTFPEGT